MGFTMGFKYVQRLEYISDLSKEQLPAYLSRKEKEKTSNIPPTSYIRIFILLCAILSFLSTCHFVSNNLDTLV